MIIKVCKHVIIKTQTEIYLYISLRRIFVKKNIVNQRAAYVHK